MWQRAVAVWTCYADQVEFLRLRAWQGLFQTGIDAMDQGDTARAIRHLEDAFTIYKQEPDPIFEVGVYYARRAEEAPADSQLILVERATQAFRRALEATERSTRLEPGARRQYRARSALNLATLLSYQEKLDEAAAVYEEFLRVEPDNQEARAKLARVLAMQVERLVSQADTTPDTDQAATLLARAEELRHEAASHYDALLEQPGLQAGDYQEIGIGLWEAGAQDRALAAFRKVIELRPYDPGALEVLAHALYQAERYDTLVTVAESLSVRYPYHRENLAVLAYAYRQLKQPEQALSVLERQQRLPFQILEPSLQSANGAYVAAGALENLTLEPGAPIEVEFQFRRESGEIVATATLATAAPGEGGADTLPGDREHRGPALRLHLPRDPPGRAGTRLTVAGPRETSAYGDGPNRRFDRRLLRSWECPSPIREVTPGTQMRAPPSGVDYAGSRQNRVSRTCF